MQKERINVLIIEDDEQKAKKFSAVLVKIGIPERDVHYVKTSLDAEMSLMNIQYDVILLDLVLPPWEGKLPVKDSGQRLLKNVFTFPQKYKMPKHIFIISEYEDAVDELMADPDRFYVQQIKYDASSAKWEEELTAYIKQIWRVQDDTAAERLYDIAILCALREPELDEILHLPFDWKPYHRPADSTNYHIGTYKEKRIICAAAYEMGMPAASALAAKVAEHFKPEYIIMTGIAAGVDRKKLNYGDIIVADPCFDYGSGKRSYEKKEPDSDQYISVFRPDYKQRRLDGKVLQLLDQLSANQELLSDIEKNCPTDYSKPGTQLRMHIGAFASGAAVLSDPTVIRGVLDHARKLLGFDMEAYGIMLAGSQSSEPASIPIVIKSVSDFGDTKKDDNFQSYASYTSAKMAQHLIELL